MYGLGHAGTTILTTETPVPGQMLGRLTKDPQCVQAATISPLLVITVTATLVGAWQLISMRTEQLTLIYFEECNTYTARMMYYQVAVESTLIVLCILPLAGIMDVYALAFASALTWAEFLMYLYSDLINVYPLNNWEIIYSVPNPVPNNPVQTLRNYSATILPIIQFTWEPLMGALFMHIFIYIIVFIHVIKGATSPSYSYQWSFITIVIITAFLQLLIPFCKIAQFVKGSRLLAFLTVYRLSVLSLEIIEFLNITIIILFLIMT
jgi:hypothetical protein